MRKRHLPYLFAILLLGSSLSLKSQSNLWGVTTAGGNGGGSIFGISTGSTAFSSQYNMVDYSGFASSAMLTKLLEVNGKLYGTTTTGGSGTVGVIFCYDPTVNTYTPLASFTGTSGAVMGSQPNSGLMLASNGKLYGMTRLGGANNLGTIFSYDISSNTYSLLASFTGTTGSVMGSQPVGGLMQANDGKLYGLTSAGGTGGGTGSGVIFQFDPSANTYSLLASFTGTAGAYPGSSPQGCTLVEGITNKLHGLTSGGGSGSGGVLFEYDYSAGTYTTLVNFVTNAAAGSQPLGALVKASNGKLYGTTNAGGANSAGVLFEYDLSLGVYTKDVDMAVATGTQPRSGLIQASNGKLYGTTRLGGVLTPSVGTIFEYDISSSTFTKKYDFVNATGSTPLSSVVQYSGNGKLYGLTSTGGSTGSGGVIYEYDLTTNTYTKKIDLGVSTGGQPNGGLVLSSVTNKLYGMAAQGSTANIGAGGAIYEYDYTNNTYVKKVDLTSANGRFPYGGLVQATNTNLYGLMSSGGTSGLGTLIQYVPGATTYSKVMDFTGANGSTPYGSMVQASNGNLYGLTSAGGANGAGVLFEYNLTTSTYTDKYDFSGTNGTSPYGSLVIASNGKAYGVTSTGGANGAGVLFEYDITNSIYTKKVDLSLANGANPFGALVQANNGNLYGMTRNGGANSLGVIFEYNITTNTYTKKIDLTSTNGSLPYGSLIKAANGLLYGLTTAGGTNTVGVMFEYNSSSNTFTKKMDLSTTTGALPGYTQLMEICTLPAAASAISSATSAVCFANSAPQNFSISTISNATSYTWTVPSGASITSGSNTSNATINFSGVAAGVYTITAAGVNVCGTGTLSSKTITINTLPTISAPNSTICSGTSATIVPSGASSYVFQGGSAVVSPTSTTSYTVTGTDANGCTAASPATVVVTVNSSPVISVPSGSICQGSSFSLSPTGASTYSVNGLSGGLLVSPTITTTYSVTGTATNGCTSPGTAVATVTVNSIPFITVNSGSICSGNSFTIVPNGAGVYNVTGNNFTVSPTGNTSYSVTGTSTAGCAASNTAVASVTVNTTPTISVNSGSICSGGAFTINPLGANLYTVTGNVYTVSPGTTTSYTLTGASSAGCPAGNNPVVSTVSVYTTPTITASSGSICTGGTYTIITTNGGVGIASSTLAGGSSTLVGNNFLVNPATTSVYSIAVTSTAGCKSGTVVSTVSVNTTPVITASSGSVCSGSVYTITTTSGGISIGTYTVTGGTYTVSGTNLLVNPASTTVYSVSATSTAGCNSSQVTSNVFVNTTPTLSANSGTFCAGNVYTITMTSSTVGLSTYTVTGGTGTLSTNHYLVSPSVTSTYSIAATSTAGCVSNQTTALVTVVANPVITVNSGSICAGGIFTISPSGGGVTNFTVQGGSFTVSPSSATVYTVVGASSGGCISNMVSSSVTVGALPTISISTASAVCIGSTATLTASGANTYTWSTGPTGATFTDMPSNNTTYTVAGTDGSGCTNTATASVHVNARPNITVPSGAICPGNSFTLTPSGAVTYTYSSGSNIVSPSTTTSYSVTGTDANGCTSTLTAVATVTVSSTLPVTISGPNSVCSGSTATLTAGGASTYSWNTGITTMTATVSPTIITTYTVTGFSGSCSNSATFAVSVMALPNVQATTASSAICLGETVLLTASGALTYTWVNTTQNTATIVVTPTVNTNYVLIGANANCTNSAIVAQIVDPCTGLTSISKAQMSLNVYPNPNNGEFNIESPKAMTIVVVNAIGQVVLTQQLQEGTNTINIDKQAKGLYVIQAADSKQFKAVRIAVQ